MSDNLMIEQIRFAEGKALKLSILQTSAISTALHTLGFERSRPVIVLIGGAGGVEEADLPAIREAIATIASIAETYQAVVMDGGTHSGVMATMGEIRSQRGYKFPLMGVAAEGTVTWPGRKRSLMEKLTHKTKGPLDSHHTHFILVPGNNWGDESPWISDIATELAGEQSSVTVLINGGRISQEQDVPNSLKAERPVMVIEGTGRAADEFATHPPDTKLMQFIHISELDRLARKLTQQLAIHP